MNANNKRQSKLHVYKKILVPVMLGLCVTLAVNAVASPVIVLEDIANRTIHALKREQATLKTNPNTVYKIIDSILLPHVDVDAMSRSVLGRRVWYQATPSQKRRFNKEFTRVVTRTYASALAEYTDESVKFLPVRGGFENQSRVQVHSYIIRSDGPRIPVSYRVILRGQQWKVYDMSVEGVSLLQSFRSQYANELSQGSLDHLIERLQVQNKRR